MESSSKYNKERLEFTEIFKKFLKASSEFPEIFDIAQRNSQGRIWIIGGFIYRNIIRKIYGEIPDQKTVDVDFLIEEKPEQGHLYLPEEWHPKMTDYGNLYLTKDNVRIDLNFLFNFHSILARNLRPRISHFFTGTPLNIQSIAYDFSKKEVTGWLGVNSIRRKTVKVNNSNEARYEAQKRGISIEDLVKEKANELNFNFNLTLKKQETTREIYEKVSKRLGEIMGD